MATNKEDVIIFMIEELTNLVKQNNKHPQMNLSKVDALSDQLQQTETTIANSIARIDEVASQIQKPVKTEHRHTFDIRSSYAFISLILLVIISTSLAYALITERNEVATLRDNDLKYRYIKMKGEASPKRIFELEDLFEINRDNTKIHQINKDVEDYERAIKEKATLDEQARLRQLEAEKLNSEANTIRNK